MKLRTLSLFSGVGRIEKGLEDSGGFETSVFCEVNKDCQDVLRKHWPIAVIHGDITTLDGKPLKGKIDVISGGYPCFPAGTKINTKAGMVPIENIKVGDEILTHLGRFRKVDKTFINPPARLYELKMQGTPTHSVTAEHPYYVRKMERKWDSKNRTNVRTFSLPEWKEAKDLQPGDFVHVPNYTGETQFSSITEEQAWLMGRYVADGYYQIGKRSGRNNSYSRKVVFCIGAKKEAEFESKLVTYHACRSLNKTVTKYIINGLELLNLVKTCGKGAGSKCIPASILYGEHNIAKCFLEGYLSGDGCYTNKVYKCTSICEDLTIQMQYLILRVYGSYASYHLGKRPPTCVIEGRTVNQKDSHNLNFQKEVRKQANYKMLDDGAWIPVKSLTLTDRVEPVYNFETQEDHSYLVNNIAVHNCTGHSVAGKKQGHKDAGSGLWTHYKRLAQEIEPAWIIIENSANLRTTGLVTVLQDLWEIGYRDIRWDVLPASAYGASHRRERIWIVANRNGIRLSQEALAPKEEESFRRAKARSDFSNRLCPKPEFYGVDDGDGTRLDEDRRKVRVAMCGNSVYSRIAEYIGRAIMEASK